MTTLQHWHPAADCQIHPSVELVRLPPASQPGVADDMLIVARWVPCPGTKAKRVPFGLFGHNTQVSASTNRLPICSNYESIMQCMIQNSSPLGCYRSSSSSNIDVLTHPGTHPDPAGPVGPRPAPRRQGHTRPNRRRTDLAGAALPHQGIQPGRQQQGNAGQADVDLHQS